MKHVSLILLVFFLISCSPSQNVDLNKVTRIAVSYPQKPRPVNSLPVSIDFDENSEEVIKIKKWLKDNRDGWKEYVVTSEKTLLRVFGYGFILHISKSSVVFGSGVDGSRTRYVKPIKNGEFDYLSKP
ncbi:hypothetical protein MNBD_GAMMA10-3092 [hydrothermal vent metagenome]|uniref:Lipoprotein n=1 Tax=hydrothermal vent metagenome TaxID=652676 RepID=A0A3B0XBV2_9ZZZZ